jgi:hypothetical protein
MLYFQTCHHQMLGTETITATIPRRSANTTINFGGDGLSSHNYGLSGGNRPRWTAI